MSWELCCMISVKECEVNGVCAFDVPCGHCLMRVVFSCYYFCSIYFIPHTIQDPLIEYTSDILKIFRGSYIHVKKFKHSLI